MKRLLIASVGFALASGSAMAADLALKAPPPAPVPTWTGCYVSAGFGYGMLDDARTVTGAPFGAVAPSDSAGKVWLGAFGGGCDYQFNGSSIGPIVVGAFGEYDPMSISGNFGDPVNSSRYGIQNMSAAWYAGARAGVVVLPKLLTYIDGGFTGANIDQVNILNANGTPAGTPYYLPSASPTGWFIGGGYEYALTFVPINGLFWKTEYRFAEYDSYNQNYFHPTPGAATVHNSVDVQTITSSLVWRFNWMGY